MSAIDRFFNTLPSGVQQRLEGTYKRDGFMEPHKDSPDPAQVIEAAREREKVCTIKPFDPDAPKEAPKYEPPVSRLTDIERKRREREAEYRRLHAKGYTNVQMSKIIGVTDSTISKNLKTFGLSPNIPKKLSARDQQIKDLALQGTKKVEIRKITGQSRRFVNESMERSGVYEEWIKLRGLK